jgi:tight adherence protein C
VIAPVLAFVAGTLAFAGLAVLAPTGRRRPRPRLVRLLAHARPPAAPRDLEARVAAAGRPAGLGARELMAAKAAGVPVGAAAGLVIGALAPGRLGFAVIVAAPAAGFLAPDLWLARRAAERARRVRAELPGMLDLLRVSVEAGLPPTAALAGVGERGAGPLAAEWRAAAREVRLGVPLRDALARTSRRLPFPEVAALVGALDRATRHGAPLAETLAAQARDARLARRRRIQEEAARASPKIQLVVALLLVPSVLLLVAAALAGALLDGGALPLA